MGWLHPRRADSLQNRSPLHTLPKLLSFNRFFFHHSPPPFSALQSSLVNSEVVYVYNLKPNDFQKQHHTGREQPLQATALASQKENAMCYLQLLLSKHNLQLITSNQLFMKGKRLCLNQKKIASFHFCLATIEENRHKPPQSHTSVHELLIEVINNSTLFVV